MTETRAGTFIREMLATGARGLSGTLEVEADGARTFVYFKAGRVVFAEEGTLGETLGRLLVQNGHLTKEQYSTVIARMTQHLIDSEQMRLGEVVVELGYLTPEQVHAALVDQVRRKVLRCVAAESPRWSFDEGVLPEHLGSFPTPLEPSILEVARDVFDGERVGALLAPHHTRFPALRESPARVAERFRMSSLEFRFLGELDGGHSLDEALASPAAGEIDAPAVVVALLLADELSLADWPRASLRPGTGVHAPAHVPTAAAASPVVGAPPVAAAPRVAVASPRARVDAPAAPPPAAAPRPAPPVVRNEPRAEPKISAAPASREARPSRPPPDQQRARLEAEVLFQRGKELLVADQIARALPDLRRAAELYPEAAEFALYLGWAELREGGDDAGRLARRRELKKIAVAAVKQDRTLSFAHYVVGQLALLDGDEAVAEAAFKLAHKLDPQHLDAERCLRVLARRRATTRR